MFQFPHIPFGLVIAAHSLQRFMGSITRDFDSVHIYIDDLLIAKPKAHEHIQQLTTLFESLSDKRILANPTKFGLGKTELKFLGHQITREDTRNGDHKARTALGYTVPSSIQELIHFHDWWTFVVVFPHQRDWKTAFFNVFASWCRKAWSSLSRARTHLCSGSFYYGSCSGASLVLHGSRLVLILSIPSGSTGYECWCNNWRHLFQLDSIIRSHYLLRFCDQSIPWTSISRYCRLSTVGRHKIRCFNNSNNNDSFIIFE